MTGWMLAATDTTTTTITTAAALFLQIVISSDDPGILRTTLTREYVTLAFKFPEVQ